MHCISIPVMPTVTVRCRMACEGMTKLTTFKCRCPAGRPIALLPAIRQYSEGRGIWFTVCLFVCLFVNDFSTTRGPIHAKVRMQAYSGSGCVFSPLGGLAVPGGRKKGQMKFSLLWESMGNFCILAVFERYLSNACTDPHQILLV